MTKTVNAISPRRGKLEMIISSAIVTATSLTTAQTVDISSVVKAVEGGGLTRTINKEWVIGDDEAISDYDTRLERGDLTIAFLYTNGQEELGTDDFDLYSVLKEIAEHTADDLSLQFIWSPAGGAIGDEEFTTDADQSFIVGLTDPVGGVDTNGKMQVTLTLSSPTLTASVVS